MFCGQVSFVSTFWDKILLTLNNFVSQDNWIVNIFSMPLLWTCNCPNILSNSNPNNCLWTCESTQTQGTQYSHLILTAGQDPPFRQYLGIGNTWRYQMLGRGWGFPRYAIVLIERMHGWWRAWVMACNQLRTNWRHSTNSFGGPTCLFL
jgi:hypothetical protein